MMDVLVLNTAVVDFRHKDFGFADKLVGLGGLTICSKNDDPNFTQHQLCDWIKAGFATAGGCGNNAPLMARAGLNTAIGANLGRGGFNGLDAQARFFHDLMIQNGIDMSAVFIHPELKTGTTYINNKTANERGGIAYFSGANDDFDFDYWRTVIERTEPKIVYYMYVGLSKRADANGGADLANFIQWCNERQIITIVDTSTLTDDPINCINSARPVPAYKLLEPVLPIVDIFFTSSDEARIIENTLAAPRDWHKFDEYNNNLHSLDFLADTFFSQTSRTRLCGITFGKGAYERHVLPNGSISPPNKVESPFMAGEVVDLVGAGDAFRAGLITYLAKNLKLFNEATIDFTQALQMGNLFAALYIKAPLNDRYSIIHSYDKMLKIVQSNEKYPTFQALKKALKS